jgi:hypothetical protein
MRRIPVLILLLLLLVSPVRGESPDERTQQAVLRGLEFLARTQNPNGTWPGDKGDSPAVVSLAVLAFLGAGEIPGRSRYDPTLQASINYVLAGAGDDGFLGLEKKPSMYDHGFTTLALAELYGVVDDARIGPALDRAVRLIVRVQNKAGGWRYAPVPRDADITVTGCQMMALRAARNAGITVPEETIARGIEYLKSCQGADGGFQYQPTNRGTNHARTGIGVLILILSGESDSEPVRRGATYLREKPVNPGIRYFHYMMYYCSQAMFQLGEEDWTRWRRTAIPLLLAGQTGSGGWPKGPACEAYTTAMSLLALEPSWEYLPIFQR